MFKLSTRTRYATRLMLELALGNQRRPMLLSAIVSKQRLSMKYMEQILPLLKEAGLISAVRGAHGGYLLKRPVTQITLKDIYEAVEGRLSLADCLPAPGVCSLSAACATRMVWKDLSGKIENLFKKVKLSHIVNLEKRRPPAGQQKIPKRPTSCRTKAKS